MIVLIRVLNSNIYTKYFKHNSNFVTLQMKELDENGDYFPLGCLSHGIILLREREQKDG
jgi:hypothetical protein